MHGVVGKPPGAATDTTSNAPPRIMLLLLVAMTGVAPISLYMLVPALPVLAATPTPPLGPIWVILLVAAAASAVVLGQQCARRPLPLPAAFAKLLVAAVLGAAVMALLGYAAGGRLGNFGDVGVDQSTFAPAVFLWFAGIGALTVVMSGGITRPPRPRPEPEPEAEPEPDVSPDAHDADDPPAAEEPPAVADENREPAD